MDPEVDSTARSADKIPPIDKATEIGPEQQNRSQTQRGLSGRHVNLLALAGGIGIGLFVGIGITLSRTGPIALILGYLIFGLSYIWPLNLYVGEMMAWLPIRGAIFEMATRYVHPSLGFCLGWTYFYTATMLVCTEYSAVATLMRYWTTDVNPAVWIVMAMAVCVFLNIVAVRWYGESEFFFGCTKIILLVALIAFTLVTMCGGNPRKDAYGFRNWVDGNAVRPYLASGNWGRFLAVCLGIRYAVFTVGGPDFISMTAAEVRHPRRTIPRVAKLIVWRLVGFYILGVAALGILCASQDPALLNAIETGAIGAAASPWVVGMNNLEVSGGLPGIINFAILLSGWSCGNAFLYTASRTLYSLAQDGQAPKIFLRCTKLGVPWVCVLTVTLISCVTFMVTSNSALEVFFWFVDLTTCGNILFHNGLFWTYIGWYRAVGKQNLNRRDLPYRAPFAPWAAYWGLSFGVVIVIFLGFDRWKPFDVRGFVTSYFGVGYAFILFFTWTVVKKTRFVEPKSADIWSEKDAVDAECRHWEEISEEEHKANLKEMNVFLRTWHRMW